MRQRVEAEQMTDTGLCENGLTKILAEVVEEVRLSIDKDINGTDILHSLLSAPWLKSLLRVYECLLEYRRISPSPSLTYASALTQEIMGDMRSLPNPSPEAQELYMLLKAPNCQALLSAHDSVAQKNYGPVLPQLPDDLPEDEEAMRIVCLVKNKQPLNVGGGMCAQRDSLRRLALMRHVSSGEDLSPQASGGPSASSGLMPTPPAGQPHSMPSYQSSGNRSLCLHNGRLSRGGLNQSAPAVCSSVPVEKSENHLTNHTCARTASSTSTRCSMSPCVVFSSGVSSHPHTAPSSPPLQTCRTTQTVCAPRHTLELTKQHSLDELRTTVHSVASRMERSNSDVRSLSQRMVAVTERMTDSVEENAQALSLLAEVVDKLQGLIVASKTHEASCCASRPSDESHHVSSGPPATAKSPSVSRQSVSGNHGKFSTASSSSSSSSSPSSSSTCSSSFSSYTADFLTSQEPSCTHRGAAIKAMAFRSEKESMFFSNGSPMSRPKDDYGTIGCLSSRKRKSKIEK